MSIVATDGSSNVRTNVYEVTATGTTTLYEYDGDGNLRYEKEPNEDVRREMTWDQENRLTSVIDGSAREPVRVRRGDAPGADPGVGGQRRDEERDVRLV